MEKSPSLVIMAAGMGSRYGGLKQIDPVGPNGQIILDYSIYDAHKAGFSHIIFIIKPEFQNAFENAISKKIKEKIKIDYAFQTLENIPSGLKVINSRVKPLGTAHAIYCASKFIKNSFAVINADDFYGYDAFKTIYNFLTKTTDTNKYHYCMVGYNIENTLTENGSVSRGVCTADSNGFLQTIKETTEISKNELGEIISFQNEKTEKINFGTSVSMNMWGFTKSFTKELPNLLLDFFENKLKTNPEKAEFYLPDAVYSLIKINKADVKILNTSSRWFGVTYREDKPIVQNALAQMTKSGQYPEDF